MVMVDRFGDRFIAGVVGVQLFALQHLARWRIERVALIVIDVPSLHGSR